jgi:hypothetical protein
VPHKQIKPVTTNITRYDAAEGPFYGQLNFPSLQKKHEWGAEEGNSPKYKHGEADTEAGSALQFPQDH